MHRRGAFAAAGLAAALVVGGSGNAGATSTAVENRLSGADRYLTARAVAEATFDSATVALLASGRSYADALSASYVSGSSGAPLLLTEPDALPPGILDTLHNLDVDGIIVVGGTAAISDAVVAELEAADFGVSRIAGATRYETARKMAALLPPEAIGEFNAGRAAIVVNGSSFPDALSASPTSSSQKLPILLTTPNALSPDARASLEANEIEQVLVVGGTAAVSEAVVGEIAAMGIEVRRLAGTTRQATALRMAEMAKGELQYPIDRVILARGDDFADALAGGTRGGWVAAPVLMVASSTSLGDDARSFISDNADTIGTVDVLGGTSAIAQSVVDDAVAAARGQ